MRRSAGPAKCRLADLITLLRKAPKPDAGCWDELDEITRRQPTLPGRGDLVGQALPPATEAKPRPSGGCPVK